MRSLWKRVEAAAEKVFGGEGWPVGVDWVRVIPDFHLSMRLVEGKPGDGPGMVFWNKRGVTYRTVGLVGAEIRADGAWADRVMAREAQLALAYGELPWAEQPWESLSVRVERGEIVKVSYPILQEAEGWLSWRKWKQDGVELYQRVSCLGEEHVICFGPRGVYSPHDWAELDLLARMGEPGCGELYSLWRAGKLWVPSTVFALRRDREIPERNLCERRLDLAEGLVREELFFAGLYDRVTKLLPGDPRFQLWLYIDEKNEAGVRAQRGFELDVREWLSLRRRGVKASRGRFPLGVEGGRILWLTPEGVRR